LVRGQFILVALQWVVGIGHVIAKSQSPEDVQNALENAIEWHFALYMTLFFGLSAHIWQLQQYRWRAEPVAGAGS
jgi:cell division septal protein FtsQ